MKHFLKLRLAFLALTALGKGLEGLGFLLIFHWLYCFINLTETLPYQIEKLLIIFIYGAGPVFVVSFIIWKTFFKQVKFSIWLENQFQFNFKLINALEYEPLEVTKLLSQVNLSAIYQKVFRKTWLASVVFLMLTVMVHLIFIHKSLIVINNVTAIFKVIKIGLTLKYPSQITESQDATVQIENQFNKAEILFTHHGLPQKFNLKPNQAFTFPKFSKELTFTVNAQINKRWLSQKGQIAVIEKPVLQEMVIKVKEPFISGDTVYRGITELGLKRGSYYQIEFIFQSDQKLISLIAAPEAFLRHGIGLTNNKVVVNGILNDSQQLNFNVANQYFLTNVTPVTFQLRALVPSKAQLSILSPKEEVELSVIKNLPLEFIGESEVGFKQITLKYQILSRVLTSPEGGTLTNLNFISKEEWVKNHQQVKLDLQKLDLFPGNQITYWLEGRDGWEQLAISKTNRIKYLSLLEKKEREDKKNESSQQEIRNLLEEVKGIQKESERISLAKEKGEKITSQVENLRNKIEKLSQKISSLAESTSSVSKLLQENDGNEMTIPDPQIEKQLEAIRQVVKGLDETSKEKLKKLSQGLAALDKERLSTQQLEALRKTVKKDEVKEALDQLLNSLKEFKTQQAFNNLEKETRQLKEDFSLEKIKQLTQPNLQTWEKNKTTTIDKLEQIEETFLKLASETRGPDRESSEAKNLNNEVKQLLNAETRKKISDVSEANGKDSEQIENGLKSLAEKMQTLSRQQQGLNIEKMIEVVSRQMWIFSEASLKFNRINQGEVVDLEAIDFKALKKLTTDQLLQMKEQLETGNKNLALESAGGQNGVTQLLKKYDNLHQRIQDLLTALDSTRASLSFSKNSLMSIHQDMAQDTKILYGDLFLLKWKWQQELKDQENQSKMSEALGKQNGLSQKAKSLSKGMGANPTEAQKQAMNQLSAEQRGLADMLGKMLGKDKSLTSSSTKGNEAFTKTIEAMKAAQKALQVENGIDHNKVESTQNEVNAQFLKDLKGQKGKEEEKEEERVAELVKKQLNQELGRGSEPTFFSAEKLKKMLPNEKTLPGYEKRVKAYLETLMR